MTVDEKESENSLMNMAEKSGYQLILIDSGAFEHVCPLNFGRGLETGIPRHIVSASGSQIPYLSSRGQV